MWSFNKNKTDLNSLIKTFIESKERNLQLDFYRKNGEVLLQIFKGYDVNLWKVDIETLENDIVYQLLFHKDKTANNDNLKRFKHSALFSDFKKVDFYNQNAYFYSVPIGFSEEIKSKIFEILELIYDLGSNQVRYTLNAY